MPSGCEFEPAQRLTGRWGGLIRKMLLVTAAICILAGSPSPMFQVAAAESNPDEYLVLGTVISVQAAAGTIVIREANLFGRLRFQVKTYRVKQPSSLAGLRQ